MRTHRVNPTGVLIEADVNTTWVTTPDGHTVGRFGLRGVDVHTADSMGCVDCTHGPTGDREWGRFVEGMKAEHGVTLFDFDRPLRLRVKASRSDGVAGSVWYLFVDDVQQARWSTAEDDERPGWVEAHESGMSVALQAEGWLVYATRGTGESQGDPDRVLPKMVTFDGDEIETIG